MTNAPSPITYTQHASLTVSGTWLILRGVHPTRHLEILRKRLGGRKMQGGIRFPRLVHVYEDLKAAYGVTCDDMETPWGFPAQPRTFVTPLPLRTYQKDGVYFLTSSPLPGAILGFLPRLGKTPTAIVAARALGLRDILVVAPLSLQRTWAREFETWTQVEAYRAYQRPPVDGVNITNYDTIVKYQRLEMRTLQERLKGKDVPAAPSPFKRHWDLIIADESLLFKDRRTARYRAMKALGPFATRRWALTGSPVSRFGDDLWTQLNWVYPQGFASYWRFTDANCEIEDTVWGSNVVATKDTFNPTVMYRDVLHTPDMTKVPALPNLEQETLDLDLTPVQEKAYVEATEDFLVHLETGTLGVPNRMAQIVRQMQIASNLVNLEGGKDASSKADAIVDMIEAGTIEYPLLIWVNFRSGAEALWRRLVAMRGAHMPKGCPEIVLGSDPQADSKIELYKEGKIPILLLSLEVGKFGHTLVNTRTVVFHDRTFNADTFFQSMHRVVLPGNPSGARVITLRCPGTVDVMVEDNLAGKMPDIAKASNAELARYIRALGRG